MSGAVVNVYTTSATTDNMSRKEMLNWVNNCLQSEFSKIEQLHTGAGYCLFTEIIFPGSIQLKRVKWNGRSELDYLGNWKLVQTTWKQLGIDKIVPVDKLVKGKFQDNFEFLQWFKKFFDANYGGQEYNALEMRNFEELPKEGKIKPGAAAATAARLALRVPQPKSTSVVSRPALSTLLQRAGSNASVSSAGTEKPTSTAASSFKEPTLKLATRPLPAGKSVGGVDPQVHETIKRELEEVRQQLTESGEVVTTLEKERDFYFTKLRKIEIICQENETAGLTDVDRLLGILYETEDGFAPPDEVEEHNNEAALADGEEN